MGNSRRSSIAAASLLLFILNSTSIMLVRLLADFIIIGLITLLPDTVELVSDRDGWVAQQTSVTASALALILTRANG